MIYNPLLTTNNPSNNTYPRLFITSAPRTGGGWAPIARNSLVQGSYQSASGVLGINIDIQNQTPQSRDEWERDIPGEASRDRNFVQAMYMDTVDNALPNDVYIQFRVRTIVNPATFAWLQTAPVDETKSPWATLDPLRIRDYI